MTARRPHVALPASGSMEERYAGLEARIAVPGDVTGWDLSVVEFRLGARRLVPPHSHVSEDELSYVLEGEIGFRIGDDELTAPPGTTVYKPRGVFHSFWNASDRPVRLLEVILPAGLERSFRVSEDARRPAQGGPVRQNNVHSDEWVSDLVRRFRLRLVGE